jgi:sigma-E factor negative regulatory protein RseA
MQVSDSLTPVIAEVATPQTAATNVAAVQAIPAEYLMAHQASEPSASSYYIQSASYSE